MPNPSGTQSIDRAAQLLVAVADSTAPIGVGELAEATDLPKSTASRLVAALERHALVQRDGARGPLRPGPVMMRLARRGVGDRDLVDLSADALRAHAHRGPRPRAHAGGGYRVRAAWVRHHHARSSMTNEEILQGLYDNTLIGNAPEVKDLTNQGLELGMDPESLLYDALIP